ncbi:MAG: hypothetical protein INR68_03375 [Methylobacterium mesophilicum]|nr:hypothetical protein [Methylobacterium mesophilicum]
MRPYTITIGVPPERFQQIKTLADRRGRNMADTIGDLVNLAIDRNELEPELPGWNIESYQDGVLFENAEMDLTRQWSKPVALSLAETLEAMTQPGERLKGCLNMDARLQLDRWGTNVRLTDTETKAQRHLPRSIAADIARLIRRAIA